MSPHPVRTRRDKGSRLGPVAALAVLGLLASMTPAAAAGAAPVTSAPPTTAPVPVMIVLDASGSMNQTDAPGPRIDAAKTAVTDLLTTLPADAQVGLMVYGTGTGSTDGEKAAGCQDITTLAPIGPLHTATLTSQINAVTASGYTPIGNALRAAADSLRQEGPRSIVLVSDGEDTCAPPAPCDVARELDQQGIDLTVHTVGFKVDPTARDQLTCIAQATGGTYSDATDANGLTKALHTKVDYAITGYTTAGTPVNGADQPSEQAPLLTPGQYVDTFAVGASDDVVGIGTTKYYTISVQAGVRPYISVTLVPPDKPSDTQLFGVDAALLDTGGDVCTSETGGAVLVVGKNEPATAVLDGPTFGDPAEFSCPTEGVAILKINRRGLAFADTPLPAEIVVRMEPPADAGDVPPAAAKGDPLPAPTHGTPVGLTGGSSFNDAPRLTSGATYSGTIGTGESRFYRVPVRWGQRFSYLISEVGPAQPSLGVVGSVVTASAFNPVRAQVGEPGRDSSLWFANEPGAPINSSTPYPARYTNRNGFDQRGFSLDGDYYLRLAANHALDETSSSTPYLITVVISGEIEPGPVYLPIGSAPGTTGSAAPSPTSPGASASASGDPSVSAASPTGQASPVTDSPFPTWVWAVVALLATGAVVAVLVVWSRRRASMAAAGARDGRR